jgi:4-diphosphocytidyl-2-C-methyl-D-erythritol kinase
MNGSRASEGLAMKSHPVELRDCSAPAKLNLFLHVVGRRPDGYHLLQTVFQLIDYGDTLHFTLRDDGAIVRSTDLEGVPPEADLTVRAARLLQAAAEVRLSKKLPGANIAIDKRLPLGGGLGGGSSDAATTLMALNHLWQAGLSRAELMALGLQLGADVPFFIFGRNAFAEGVGEVLAPVETPECWYVVIEPGVVVPTAAIFSAPDLTRESKPVKITDFSESAGTICRFGKNDLQPVVARRFEPVAAAIKWLAQYGEARMTGSGACVFCAFPDENAADAALRNVPQRWKAWKARALARHPMEALLPA